MPDKLCSVCDRVIPLQRLALAPRARTCGGPWCEREHHLRQDRTAAKSRRARRRRRLTGGL